MYKNAAKIRVFNVASMSRGNWKTTLEDFFSPSLVIVATGKDPFTLSISMVFSEWDKGSSAVNAGSPSFIWIETFILKEEFEILMKPMLHVGRTVISR